MIGWQMLGKGKLEQVNKTELLNDNLSAKVKTTTVLLTRDDISAICGDDKRVTYPMIPGRMAIGQVVEVAEQSQMELYKNNRVYIAPIASCNKCHACVKDHPDKCYDYQIASKNVNGYLRDFAVMQLSQLHLLPASVKDDDAIYIEYISLALSVVDKLDISKGEHVAILGGGVLGSILAQLIIYYQGVPILIDSNNDVLDLAKQNGIYYPLIANSSVEKEVVKITGGRMANKVVYLTGCNLPIDLAYKLACQNSVVGIVGFSAINLKGSINIAMQKQLTTVCITNGYGNIEPAINILANKAVDLSSYKIKQDNYSTIIEKIEERVIAYKAGEPVQNILVNMLK